MVWKSWYNFNWKLTDYKLIKNTVLYTSNCVIPNTYIVINCFKLKKKMKICVDNNDAKNLKIRLTDVEYKELECFYFSICVDKKQLSTHHILYCMLIIMYTEQRLLNSRIPNQKKNQVRSSTTTIIIVWVFCARNH